MINLGRAVGLFNRYSPKISKGIGQVANIARNVGQVVKNVRNIGSTVNDISGGRIGSSPFGQKMQEITNKVESGANFVANNEDKAQGLVNDISRKVNA
jgi:phage-related minor tail protein